MSTSTSTSGLPAVSRSSSSASLNKPDPLNDLEIDDSEESKDPNWNWTRYTTDTGEFYYFNRQTHETTWKRPLNKSETGTWCEACSKNCSGNYYNTSTKSFEDKQPDGTQLGNFLNAIPKVKVVFKSVATSSTPSSSSSSGSSSASSSSGSGASTGTTIIKSPQETGTYGGGRNNNYGKNQNGSGGTDPDNWPTNQRELCAWIAKQPEAAQPQQNDSYQDITQGAIIIQEVKDQVNVYLTIGDGTCMLHAILTVICPEYRELSDPNKKKIGNRFRKEKVSFLPPWDASGKDETMEMSGNFKGQNIYSRGINPNISNEKAYLTDADANVFCKFFNINLIIFSDSSGVVAATIGTGGRHDAPGMTIAGPNDELLPYYFIYCMNPGHYSAMSLKPKSGQRDFSVPYTVNSFNSNTAQEAATPAEAKTNLETQNAYVPPNEQSWFYIYNSGNRAKINVGNVCRFKEGDQIEINGQAYTVLDRTTENGSVCKNYTIINNANKQIEIRSATEVDAQNPAAATTTSNRNKILTDVLTATNYVGKIADLENYINNQSGNIADVLQVALNQNVTGLLTASLQNRVNTRNTIQTLLGIPLTGGRKKSRRNRNKTKKSKKTRRSKKN